MLILTIRTDKPESEIGLFEDLNQLTYLEWHAHLELAETIHTKVSTLLKDIQKTWHELGGLVVYKGPGSFTGLRIGFSVANTLAYSLDCPIVTTNDSDWIEQGLELLKNSKSTKPVFPFYGSEVHITKPRK